jgi:hypothetical protein
MLELQDPQVRLLVLNHIVSRLTDAEPHDLQATGIDSRQWACLQRLNALDLSRLASARCFSIGVSLNVGDLQTGLRTVDLINETRTLEAYFIRHGASVGLMRALFKVSRPVTLKRRIELGARQRSGRLALPDRRTRARIYRCWHGLSDPSQRARFFQLHQAFPNLSIAVLETVLRQYEAQA